TRASLDKAIHHTPPFPRSTVRDAARRSLVTKNLGSALAAALSGAWKLPRHILRSGITAPLRHRRRPSGDTIFTHQGWRGAPGPFCWNPLKPDPPESVRADLRFLRRQAFGPSQTDQSRRKWLLSFVSDEAFEWTPSQLFDAQQEGV